MRQFVVLLAGFILGFGACAAIVYLRPPAARKPYMPKSAVRVPVAPDRTVPEPVPRADDEATETDRRADEQMRETARQVLALCSNKGAVIDWEKRLPRPLPMPHHTPVFTAHIEDVFRDPEHHPYLFFARPYDVVRVRGQYVLVADTIPVAVDLEETFFFRLRLGLPAAIAESLLQHPADGGIYAILATIRSLSKPEWVQIYPEEMIDDPNASSVTGFGGVAIAAEGNPDVFILRGDCSDMLIVTNDPRPPEYQCFRKVFDAEPNNSQHGTGREPR